MGDVKLWTREEIIAANFGGLLLVTEGDHVREVDAYRETIAKWVEAFGLVSTAVPDMEIDVDNPMVMAKRIMEEVAEGNDQIGTYMSSLHETQAKMDAEADAYRETIAKLEQRLGDMQSQFDRIAEKGLGP